MLYHPDKHRDPGLKSQAERLFNLIHQAYEVFSDPQTRAIYDIYGKRGLEMEGWEVREALRLVSQEGTPQQLQNNTPKTPQPAVGPVRMSDDVRIPFSPYILV